MPRAKTTAAASASPYERAGSAAVNAMVERVAPDILGLLGDGGPRRKPAIVAALAGRHVPADATLALIRLCNVPGPCRVAVRLLAASRPTRRRDRPSRGGR